MAGDDDLSLPSAVTVPTDSSPQQQPTGGDQVAMETAPTVATETKTSIPEPPGRPKQQSQNADGGRGRVGGSEEGKEKRTVFVSNLKMSVTKEEVEEKFSEVSCERERLIQ